MSQAAKSVAPAAVDTSPASLLRPAAIAGVQPGGGWCMALELAWGRLRRRLLRRFRPGYVADMAARRLGECPNCPHDIVDPRDLKYWRNVCGYHFRPEDDRFRWRGRLGLVRIGLCEVLVCTVAAMLLSGVFAVAAAWGLASWVWLPGIAAVCLLWLLAVAFFRDPERAISTDPATLASPADGTVTDVGEVAEPDFPGGRAFRVGIFLSVFNVHVNRAARAGCVVRIEYYPGRFRNALSPESLLVNEQLWTDVIEPCGRRVRIKQIAGAIARRIVCWLKVGDQLKKGERIGMIKFGSRTEVLVPVEEGIVPLVKPGDKVKGGATVLLRLGGGANATT